MEMSIGQETAKAKTVVVGKTFRLVEHSEVQPGLFALVFDLINEKVNKLGPAVVEELRGHLDGLKDRKGVKALLVISGKPSIFIAGADIDVIRGITDPAEGTRLSREGQAVIQRLEDMKFPVIAAINGASMGGGTELALCCKYIIVSDNPATKIAMPEVNLGVLPGFGGTVRLPERIGLQASMDYILTGKNMSADKAVKLGFADAMFPYQNFEEHAIKFAARVIRGEARKAKRRKPFAAKVVSALLEETPAGRAILFTKARKMIMSKTQGHYPAPLKILDVLSATAGMGPRKRAAALTIEQEAFGELAVTPVSKRLIELFFATEAIKKQSGVPGFKLDAADPANKVERIGLVGAGVMGGGIAQLSAAKGIPVRMKDIDYKGLAAGTAAANKLFSDMVRKKRLSRREAALKMALISPTLDYSGFGLADVVVEAVIENMDIKRRVLREVEEVMKKSAIFATNTSSLSVTELATVSKRPENVVGMHFFNPVHKMPLVEVIRGAKTSDRAVAQIFELSKRLGKIPVVVKDGPGFLVNRLLMPYLNEASYIIAENAPIDELDRIVVKFGMPMGPATLLDEIGIDVGIKVAHILHDAFGDRVMPGRLNDRLYDAKLLGKKSGKGFYLYDAARKREWLNPEIYSVIGTTPGAVSKEAKDDWIPRMIYPMVNEAAMCLGEGVVMSPQDLDLAMIMGTGFPPFFGGLLRYADSVGVEKITAKLEELSKKFGVRFVPSAALIDVARRGGAFYAAK